VRIRQHVKSDPRFLFWRAAGGVLGPCENCHADFVLVLLFPGAVVRAAGDAPRLRLQSLLFLGKGGFFDVRGSQQGRSVGIGVVAAIRCLSFFLTFLE